jgi:hypothetical protein
VCERDVSILLILKQGDTLLWRGASPIHPYEYSLAETNDNLWRTIHVVDFTLPAEVSEILEAAAAHWVKRHHPWRFGLPECDVTGVLQTWVHGFDDRLDLLQPHLVREAIRYERRDALCCSIGTFELGQLVVDGVVASSISVVIKTYRLDANRPAARGHIRGHVVILCSLKGNGGDLIVHILSALRNAYSYASAAFDV